MLSIQRLYVVGERLGLSSTTSIYNHIRAGLLPHPVQVSVRSVGIPSNEIDAIIKARIEGQTEEQIKALVLDLHAARAAESGKPFNAGWLARSAEHKAQAKLRKPRRNGRISVA